MLRHLDFSFLAPFSVFIDFFTRMLHCRATLSNQASSLRTHPTPSKQTFCSMSSNIVRSAQEAIKVWAGLDEFRHAPPPCLVIECLPPMQIAGNAKRVAVLGIKTEAQASQPAFSLPSEPCSLHGCEAGGRAPQLLTSCLMRAGICRAWGWTSSRCQSITQR